MNFKKIDFKYKNNSYFPESVSWNYRVNLNSIIPNRFPPLSHTIGRNDLLTAIFSDILLHFN